MKAIRRAFALFLAWLNVRSVQIELNDIEKVMRDANNEDIALGLAIRRAQLNRELAAANAIYSYVKNQDSRATRLAI